MKRLVCLLMSVFLMICPTLAISNLPSPTSEFFVNDFANVIEAEDEKAIFDMAKSLYQSSGNSTQVVVVTISSLEGNSIEEYANELFNRWEIGSKEKDDGVLLLLAVEDRESRIEVGYGLEGVLTDGKTGRIQDDYMIPYYKNNDFSEGLKSGTKAIIDVLNGNLEISEAKIDDFSRLTQSTLLFMLFPMIMVFGIFGFILFLFCNVDKVKVCKKCNGRKFNYRKQRIGDHLYTYSTCLNCGEKYTKSSIIISSSSGGGFSSGGFSGGGGHSGGGGSSRSF